jgi:hypothetical protein
MTEYSRVSQVVSTSGVAFLQTAKPTDERRLHFSALAMIYGPTLLFLAATLWAKFHADVPIGFFSRDPMATLKGHPLTGIQSTLGILVWCAAAGICFFSCLVLHRTQSNKRLCWFLLWTGVISSVLALDDMFLVHEDLAHRYLGVNEKVVFLAYGALVAWYLSRFRGNIRNTEYLLLFVAFAFFGSSIVVDVLHHQWSSAWRIFFEEGLKLLGIVTWSGYVIRTCFHAIAAPINLAPRS